MNKWGIGLLIVNLLAAVGLTYYALEDRAKRRDINAAVARYYLALHGLPVDGAKISGDSVDIHIETANGVPIDGIPVKVLQTYLDAPGGARFGATGDPVTTQFAEVNRVVQQVNAAVGGMNTPREKLAFLAGSFANPGGRRTFTPGILVYLARNADDRDAARELAKNPNGENAGKALQIFSKIAADVTTPGADSVVRSRVAHFLTSLEPTDDGWQKRVALVVGLRTYLKAISEQDLVFQDIANRVARRYEDDQATFVAQYQLLTKLSIQRSLLLSRQEEIKNELDVQQQKDSELLNMKKSSKDKSVKIFEDLSKEVATQSAANAALESAVHNSQRTVGQLLDEILKLEADLNAVEQQRNKGR
ncbi:MAG TPA: hypothetical protein VGJ05_04300 [Fimbriiglobus sp.]|jgi:hypothetical protein